MNTVLMYVIMCLVCRFQAPRGGFRNLKFDLLYKCINVCILTRLSKLRSGAVILGGEEEVLIIEDSWE